MQHPARLYRFSDVGMVCGFAHAADLEIVAHYEVDGVVHAEKVTLPRGNWVLMVVESVGSEEPGFFTVDNPNPKTTEEA